MAELVTVNLATAFTSNTIESFRFGNNSVLFCCTKRTGFFGSDYVIGGTQDNGSYALIDSVQNLTSGTETTGGDGAESDDQVGGHYMINNYIYNNVFKN